MKSPLARSPHSMLCRWLSGALGQKLESVDLPKNDDEFRAVLALSSSHLVTPILRWAACEQGLFTDLPNDVRDFLDAVRTLNFNRNRQYQDQLSQLVQVLNDADVRPVLLKGAAALVGELYPTQAERIIGDIDILVPSQRLSDILERLRKIGYQPAAKNKPLPDVRHLVHHAHQYPALRSGDWLASVELHVHPVHISAKHLLTTAEVLQEAQALRWRNVDLMVPSLNHFVVHNAIHAYIVDFAQRGSLSLRQLFEFAHARRVYADNIDWKAITDRFSTHGYEGAFRQYLAYATAYLGICDPLESALGSQMGSQKQRMHPLHSIAAFSHLAGLAVKSQGRSLLTDSGAWKKLFTRRLYDRCKRYALEISQYNAAWRKRSSTRT